MKNNELFIKVSKLKTKNSVFLFFILYKKGAVRETDLLNIFRMGAHSLRAVLSMLVNLGYAKFVMDKDNITYYMMDRQFYEVDSELYKKIGLSESNVKFLNVCENVKHVESPDNKKVADIVEFVEKLYTKTFRGLKYPYSVNVTKKFAHEMLFLFKKLVKSTVYDDTLKAYLELTFKRMSESAGFNMRKLSDMDRIVKFIDNKANKSSSTVLSCQKHDINCAYWDAYGCRLEKDGVICSDKVREHMKKKYGCQI